MDLDSHVPSVRGGSPNVPEYIRHQVDQITVHLDPRIRLRNHTEPMKLSSIGFWNFRLLEVSNARCAWPGEED
ncbi:MAG: hypothetical protein ACRKFN_14210 [Desulfitobacterium sp.]